jgi:hypothetical protein
MPGVHSAYVLRLKKKAAFIHELRAFSEMRGGTLEVSRSCPGTIEFGLCFVSDTEVAAAGGA